MRHKFFLTILTIFSLAIVTNSMAETENQSDMLKAIEHFTKALEALDADAARAVMEPTATIILSRENEAGEVRHSIRSRDEYLATWGQLDGATVEEKMWNPVVQMDGPIATVWMDYEFYLNGAFRQCGKNGFNMIRQADGWKMAGVVSSVRQTGCNRDDR